MFEVGVLGASQARLALENPEKSLSGTVSFDHETADFPGFSRAVSSGDTTPCEVTSVILHGVVSE